MRDAPPFGARTRPLGAPAAAVETLSARRAVHRARWGPLPVPPPRGRPHTPPRRV